MARLSLNLRRALLADESEEVPVVLVTIDHASWSDPVYFSSDPTTLLSNDPLAYGTISNGITYYFVLMSVILPDKVEGEPPTLPLVFENVDKDMAAVLRSMDHRAATIDLKFVLASDPDSTEEEYLNYKGVRGLITEDKITVNISRLPLVSEPSPSGRFTRSRFPALFVS